MYDQFEDGAISDACQTLDTRNQRLDVDEGIKNEEIPKIYIAPRGGCSFVQKTRNMEDVGIAVSLIYDSTDESVENIVMSDDGTGDGIQIPGLIITKNDGEKLMKYFKEASSQVMD